LLFTEFRVQIFLSISYLIYLQIQKNKTGVVKHFELGALEEIQKKNNSRSKETLGEGGTELSLFFPGFALSFL
jgi:hypothetical protein